QKIVSDDLIEQFDRALASVITIVTEAGGKSDQIARLIIYVIDKDQYRTRMKEIGERYRARMGKHFPAMVLVQIAALLEHHAKSVAMAIRRSASPRHTSSDNRGCSCATSQGASDLAPGALGTASRERRSKRRCKSNRGGY